MTTTSKNFHPGEVAMHQRWGTDTEAYETQSRQMMLPDVNPREHVFINSLTFSMAGSVDAAGRPWASPLFSLSGVADDAEPTRTSLFHVETPREIRIAPQTSVGDPLLDNVAETGKLSVVFMEHATRRRAKSIGNAVLRADGSLHYTMTRLFGICPKYIYKRTHEPARELPSGVPEQRSTLNAIDRQQLAASTTIWFASHGPHGADVTHRGGNAGFVDIVDEQTLLVPDYFGNGMFNTLGNLVLDNRLAITDVDLATGRVLHLTGTAETEATGATGPDQIERHVRFTIDDVRISFAPAGTWTDIETSRYSPPIAASER